MKKKILWLYNISKLVFVKFSSEPGMSLFHVFFYRRTSYRKDVVFKIQYIIH